MVAVVVAFVAGQLVSGWLVVPAAVAVGACAGLVLGCVAGSGRAALGLRVLSVAVLGAWLAARASVPPEGCFLPPSAEKHWFEGLVLDVSSSAPDRVVLGVRAEVVRGHERRPVCGKLLLTLAGEVERPRPGDRVRVHGSLRRPTNFANPGAEDRVGALARRGIFATAFSTGPIEIRREPGVAGGWLGLERRREEIAARIGNELGPREAGFLRAVVLGDGSAVDDETRRHLVDSGLAHLLAVSGLHVGAVWGTGFLAVRLILSRSERLLLHTNVRALAAVLALVPAGFYGLLAGGRAPTTRALLMTALLAAALAVGREAGVLRVLVLAGGVLAATNPGAPLDVSWQLSFTAVLGIVAGTVRWIERRDPRPSAGWWRFELALLVPALAFLATAPLTAFHFARISPAGLLTNPVLVPLAGIPATLLGLSGVVLDFVAPRAADAAFRLAGVPATLLLDVAGAVASLPLASLRVPPPTILELGLVYAALALPWLPQRRASAVILLVVAVLDAASWVHDRFGSRDLRIRFLDVGQGDAAVAELPGGFVLVVDGGGFARSRFDVGERVVGRYLLRRRILRVDALVATHGDWDHQGGLHALARDFAPRELWRSADPGEARRVARLEARVLAAGGRVRTLSAGDVFRHRGVRIECLHPPPTGGHGSPNDASLVLRVTIGQTSVLLPGDLEAAGEATLLASPVAADVIKVPHHGSRTSSTRRFLAAVRPRVAVVSAGSGNRYGHPHAGILKRYRALGARIVRTDQDGSILLHSDGRTVAVHAFVGALPARWSVVLE